MNFLTLSERRLLAFIVGAALVGVVVKSARDAAATRPVAGSQPTVFR